jgi:hypothetical protein
MLNREMGYTAQKRIGGKRRTQKEKVGPTINELLTTAVYF